MADLSPSQNLCVPPLEAVEPRRVFGLVPNAPHQNPSGAVVHATNAGDSFDLAIVEFDDQGLCYQRAQMDALQAKLDSLKDAIIVLFVHGWKHDARSDDDNLVSFRTILGALARVVRPTGRPVLGVFAAWRGMSLYGPLLIEATFFGRKEAALRVALGSVRELFIRLRRYRNQEARDTGARLIVIGHSFGGLITYSALAQSLVDAAALPPSRIVPSFGDVVLLVNPAFEAARYLPVYELIEARRAPFARDQRPVFISVTARNDTATGFWFPLGMRWAARGESTRTKKEREALVHTMGHIPWLITHRLTAPTVTTRARHQQQVGALANVPHSRFAAVDQSLTAFAQNPAGVGKSQRFPGGAVLTQVAGEPHNPFWVVEASREVVDGHNGIWGQVFAQFVWAVVTTHL